jgi:hypothetical protein
LLDVILGLAVLLTNLSVGEISHGQLSDHLSVATFYQLQDANTPLTTTTPVTLSQFVDVTPAGGEGALVTWMAQRTSAEEVTYTVTLNGVVLNTYTVNTVAPSTEKYAMQDAFHTSNVKKGQNVLAFTVTGGAGTLEISDVMLWVRVKDT